MPAPLAVFQLFVAPVILISAGGLICLALYNRLAMIVSRARQFHKERFDAAGALKAAQASEPGSVTAGRLKERIALLDRQSREVRGRARLVRDSLIGMMATIGCMLACSLALGASLGWRGAVYVAIGLFVLGVLAMGWAVVLATVELSRSLGPVTLEASAVEGELPEGSEALAEPAGV
ncbi:MAG: DUF2721 domain-containing protein [Planctomycetota bacterium]